MAGRQPINDQFGNERLVTQARPISQVSSQQRAPDMRGWEGLANAFAQGEMVAQQVAATKRLEDADRANAYANSKTVEELSQEIKSGKLLASESPVFAATVRHIYGRNTFDALERDVISQVTTGQRVFKNQAEVDAHLVEARNAALEGADEYTQAGFDKGFVNLRPKLMDAVAKYNDKKQVESAAVMSGDALRNHLLKVTGPEFSGTPKEGAESLLQEYQFLRLSKALPDSVAKDTLKETIAAAAAGGRPELVTELLNSTLPNLGSVRGFLGETTAITLEGQSAAHFDKNERQRIDDESAPWYQAASEGRLNEDKFRTWATAATNKRYTSAAFVQSLIDRNNAALERSQREMQQASMQAAIDASEAEAKAKVDAALADGTLYKAQGTNNPQVLTKTGDTKDFDVKGYAEQSLKARTADMPFEQQVNVWAMNGLAHPDWENQIKAGLHNLASIGIDSKGKPTGQLNEESKKALALFRDMNSVNPTYAKQVAGETAYNRFSDIEFLQHLGRTPEDSAAISANAASGAIIGSDVGKVVSKIQSAANDLVGNPWYKPDWWSRAWGDSTSHNTSQVTGMVRRYATLLAHSGQYGNADDAIKAAAEYIGRPQVSARVNGTLYLRTELPQAPQAESQEEWFGKFIEKVPKATAVRRGFNQNEVRLEYNQATKGFTAMMGNLPMLSEDGKSVVTYSKDEIQEWYGAERQARITKAAIDRTYEVFKSRINTEIGRLQRDDRFVMERYDSSFNQQLLDARIMSREAYEQIVKDGNRDKPLSELMKLYPAQKPKK